MAAGEAGEIGHVVVDPAGPRCGCGRQGCLESLISGPVIAGQILHDQPADKSLVKLARQRAAVALVDTLVRQADAGNVYARGVIDRVVELAARALAQVVACFAPDRVVVAGYVFKTGRN